MSAACRDVSARPCEGTPWQTIRLAEENQIETQSHAAPVAGAELLAACKDVLAELTGSNLPLEVPDVANKRRHVSGLRDHLADYLLPRLTEVDSPLLIVVGGSTGAGKSTLVNSLAGDEVSETGVVRPTTRRPVLIHHPDDSRFFTESGPVRRDWDGLDPVIRSHPGIPAGLALVDAPDIDSVEETNRVLADRLMAAADLWLFTTTAARYADAVPWEFLRKAAAGGTTLAVALDRVPSDSSRVVRRHLSHMLVDAGLESAPLFMVPEVPGSAAVLPAGAVAGLRSWIDSLSANPRSRALIARRTLRGACASVVDRVDEAADHFDEQAKALAELNAATQREFDAASGSLAAALTDGRIVRGEVLARWQDFIGMGQFFLGIESSLSRIRSRVSAAISGDRDAAEPLGQAIRSGQADLIREGTADMLSRLGRAWRQLPAGRALLADADAEEPGSERAIQAMLREWTGHVLELVRTEARGKRAKARILSFGIDGVAAVLMVAVVAADAHSETAGSEAAGSGAAQPGSGTGQADDVPSPADTAAMAGRLLSSLFGDQAKEDLTEAARTDLRERVGDFLSAARRPYTDKTDAVEASTDKAARLREAGRRFQENQ